MYQYLLLASGIVLLSIFSCKALYRFGVPSLLIFLVLGMLFGSDGIGGIEFDNFKLAESLSSFALVFIMFFGGFGIKWSTARPVALQAGLLSSLGTVITALITALFAMLVLQVDFLYGLVFGSVIASTDAASVFSILRSRKLNLKGGLAPLLELESGSNDPIAYLMTIISVALLSARGTGSVVLAMFQQVAFGALIGIALALLAIFIINRIKLEIEGFYPLLLAGLVILSYALSSLIGGNGFLCVFVFGIIVGNHKITHKLSLMSFFDALSWLMQLLLFFVLGLLSFPSQIPTITVSGVLMAAIIILVSRPVAVFSILSWFKVPIRQQLFVSWVGLRGAASIVFAIVAVSALGGSLPYDIFHIVFFVALFSVLIQGSLTPFMAKKLDLVENDDENAVLKTFNDYHEDMYTQLMEYEIVTGHPYAEKKIMDTDIPDEVLVVMIRRNGNVIVPKGSTEILAGDVLVLSADNFDFVKDLQVSNGG